MFWCYIWCIDPDSNRKTLFCCRKLVQLHHWTTWYYGALLSNYVQYRLFLQEFIYKKILCFFFPVVVFIRNTHTRPKTHTAGRKETIKSLFSSSPPVFATIFTQKMHNPCIQLRLIGNESHWEQFKMWQMCLPATQRILVNNKTGSDPLKCPELMPFRWESASQSRHLHEKMLHTDCYFFFFSFLSL